MRANLPSRFEVRTTLNNRNHEGAYVSLSLITDYKNNYSFLLGPSNEQGEVSILKDEIIEKGRQQLEAALMDYGPIQNVYTGEYSVRVLQKEDLERVIKAYERYQAEKKKSEILKLRDALAQWHEGLRDVVATCDSVEG
ncbi:MAG: hypothetical protein AAGH40_05660 [Verrucomicrobiota bacterium]